MAESNPRRDLALNMISTLPTWGTWAASMREVDTPYGRVGYRQASIMWAMRYHLVSPEDQSTTGLATYLGIQNSVITRACERLEHLGLVDRTIDATDRRRSHLSLTENGDKASVYIEELYLTSLMKATSELDDDAILELQHAVALLQEIAERTFQNPPGS